MSTRTRKSPIGKSFPAAKAAALVALADGPMTASELGKQRPFLDNLVKSGHVKVVGHRKHVNPDTGETTRGRPANVYGPTPKGRAIIRRRRAGEAASALA